MVGGHGRDGCGYGRRNSEGEPGSGQILAIQNFQHALFILASGKVYPIACEVLFLSQPVLTFSLLISISS